MFLRCPRGTGPSNYVYICKGRIYGDIQDYSRSYINWCCGFRQANKLWIWGFIKTDGLYFIDVSTHHLVSTDDSKDLIVNNQGIYYIKEDNTLYKIEQEKYKLIDKEIEWCMKTSDYIVYNSLSKPTLHVVQ